jgi:LPXTG-motif cell wall-anchored protein
MILRRVLVGSAAALLLGLTLPVAPAAAAPAYPPNVGRLQLSATVAVIGTTITATGSGFAANSGVSLSVRVATSGFAGTTGAADRLGAMLPAGPAAATTQRFAAAACSTGVDCSVTTGGNGTFTVPITLTQLGTTVVTATGTAPGGGSLVLSASVLVIEAAGAGGIGTGDGGASGEGSLPDTGASIRLPATIGAILVLGGAGLITAVRRRRRGPAAA